MHPTSRPTSLYECYVFLICLLALGGIIVCLLGGLYSAVGVLYPDGLMREHEWEWHQTNDRYWEWTGRRSASDSGWFGRSARPPEDELTRRRTESYEVARDGVRRDSWVMFVMYGVGLGVSLVMFAVHWRLAKAFRLPPERSVPAV
jgi:hypothetical protein